MSERTAPALARLQVLMPLIEALPESASRTQLRDETAALGRAIDAFHMEAIRFRIHAVERLLKSAGGDARTLAAFDELRQTLEAAGFHTRSHAAP
jgi:hypothetical protein